MELGCALIGIFYGPSASCLVLYCSEGVWLARVIHSVVARQGSRDGTFATEGGSCGIFLDVHVDGGGTSWLERRSIPNRILQNIWHGMT